MSRRCLALREVGSDDFIEIFYEADSLSVSEGGIIFLISNGRPTHFLRLKEGQVLQEHFVPTKVEIEFG